MYVEETEPLKIGVGKFYRTRNGKKAIVLDFDKDKAYGGPARVAIIGNSLSP